MGAGLQEMERGIEQPVAGRRRRIAPKGWTLPGVVGVVALLLAGLLGYVTLRDTVFDKAAAASDESSHEYLSREGGFSVTAPTALKMDAKGHTMKFTSKDKSLVINVGPGEEGSIKAADQGFLARMKQGYRRFDLMATESVKVDGRPALTSSGQATNANNVRIRFVVVTVQAKPRNYTIAAYTAYDSDPTVVLPLVNAVANGFHVLG